MTLWKRQNFSTALKIDHTANKLKWGWFLEEDSVKKKIGLWQKNVVQSRMHAQYQETSRISTDCWETNRLNVDSQVISRINTRLPRSKKTIQNNRCRANWQHSDRFPTKVFWDHAQTGRAAYNMLIKGLKNIIIVLGMALSEYNKLYYSSESMNE